MHTREDGLYFQGLRKYEGSLRPEDRLPQTEKDVLFAMRCNGHFLTQSGEWQFSGKSVQPYLKEFKGQKITFIGPNAESNFYSAVNIGPEKLTSAFSSEPVAKMIRKYREIDDDVAARGAFVLGGIVRHVAETAPGWRDNTKETKEAVDFVAGMSMLADERSADAVTAAMAMYVLSGGSLDKDPQFVSQVYRMAEAVSQDPIRPQQTRDLGRSQVTRLHTFVNGSGVSLPDTSQYGEPLADFPTVGAEFHLPVKTKYEDRKLWQKLALLNMSQYQRGSYIQMSRNDKDVIEVRMNPSVYPVAIADWNHMRILLPELNDNFFTATFNRKVGQNFNWKSGYDKVLLDQLRSIGMLSYASVFSEVPEGGKDAEIDFGSIYLGQTIRVANGDYQFSGHWGGNEGSHGQLGVYTGFGKNFPQLAYNLSMVLHDPSVLRGVDKKFLSNTKTLSSAMDAQPRQIEHVFRSIQERVNAVEPLKAAYQSGNKIMELLYP